MPFWAVTTVLMVLGPTAKGMDSEAVPDATAVPFTFTVAFTSLVVGVNLIEETLLATDAV